MTTVSKPELKAGHGVYTGIWDHEGIGIQVDRVVEDSHHLVSAEFLVRSIRPSQKGHIYQARLNLLSATSKKTFAKECKERIEDVDWDTIIEKMALYVMERYREGDPVVTLTGTMKRATSQYLLKPILLDRQTNILFGDGGTAKSTLALACCLSLSTKTPYLGVVPPYTAQCLYLDWEWNAEDHDERLDRMSLHDNSQVKYKRMYGNLANQVESILPFVLQNDIGLVIVDSGAAACGGNPESAENTLLLFDALRRLNTTCLVICHNTKEGQEKPFGSAFWFNMARNIWMIRKEQEPGKNELHVGLFHKKSNSQALEKAIGFGIFFEEDRINIMAENIKDSVTLSKNLPDYEQIKQYLLHKPNRTIKEIAEALQMQYESVKGQLNHYTEIFDGQMSGKEKRWFVVAN